MQKNRQTATIERPGEEERGAFGIVSWRGWLIILVAAIVFLSGVVSPPSLMDDVDAAQGQMARNMLASGDWVTARLDGVIFLDKAPLKYWMTIVSYTIFGVHDWSARLPLALSAIVLCWVVARFGRWAFSADTGMLAGLALATCVGLFLFTRIVIPDVILTLSITVSMWAFLRVLDPAEQKPRLWAALLAASLACGVLLKGLVGLVLPLGGIFFYLFATRTLFDASVWKSLRLGTGIPLFLLIAVPWHVLAILRNPPYFDFTMHSEPGKFRGFFWFYFINEHVLRFLNERYPRDYNTVPRASFWLLHLAWLFPWSAYLPSVVKLSYRPGSRRGNTHLMLACWFLFVLLFFSFSTTQEYYSMPVYPALALLIASGMTAAPRVVRIGTRAIAVIAGVAAAAACAILALVHGIPAPGDISRALSSSPPDAYTLSLGHMQDLTLRSFAYLRAPLAVAALAFAIGCIGGLFLRGRKALASVALMMVLFFQAARMALAVFDPYMSSRPIAEALNRVPKGNLIIAGPYYTYSSVFFYTGYDALILNGRVTNLEYGSYAPDAPQVFITDKDLPGIWDRDALHYLIVEDRNIGAIENVVGRDRLHLVASAGGKSLFSNRAPELNAGLQRN